MVSLDDVARIATELPEVVEIEQRGGRAWAVPGATRSGGAKVFAWERPFSKADLRRYGADTPPDGPILAIRVIDLHEKEAVLAENTDAFFTIPHFNGYAAVLVQLDAVTEDALRDALLDGWRACAPPELADRYRP
ncbi:hypothetical protein K1T35_44090 [Pseudonocardia sp. DSM 110487]|uniref:MmcQ/YjbR family DNA-binding protein n=1 Tax=Pseudonocardia sp. DSM 110487 TaxID=2865833 RepID=UPI001C6A86BF|nr:hypothetical protein [Pseudonocardia sp. DSM 110487]QYN35236.1 hypothetical protein K1T35_44090 [Pseudonocardia sp. DSM 110487]